MIGTDFDVRLLADQVGTVVAFGAAASSSCVVVIHLRDLHSCSQMAVIYKGAAGFKIDT